MATDATDPIPTRSTTTHPRRARSTPTHSPRTPSAYPTPSTSAEHAPPTTSTPSQTKPSSSCTTNPSTITSTSSRSSLTSLRESISENPHIYNFSEIRSATNNFLLKKHSSSSSSTNCWRCLLRGKDVIIFQRKFRRKLETESLRDTLAKICRSHHNSIIKLLGASISDDYIYLVYDYINGANLSDCLRNMRNPNFTVLSSWMSRMQIATDLAHGLDYIHNKTGLNLNFVHNHIKSSSIVVTEPLFNAKICHFGTAQLCGETDDDYERRKSKGLKEVSEISEEVEATTSDLTRSSSGRKQFEGVRGYMSPEFRATGIPTQKSDVYALGVVILELLSGEEPLKYKYEKTRGEFTRTSVIDTASLAIDGGGGGGEDNGGREGRLRVWMDRRLRDSFPVDVAEGVTRVALECVDVDPDKRPDMERVSRKISKLYMRSEKWSESIKMPTDISVSLAPRS